MHKLNRNRLRTFGYPSLLMVFMTMINFFPVFADESLNNSIINFRNEIIEEINKQRLSYTEDMRFLQEQRVALSEEVSSYSEIVDNLTNKIHKQNQLIDDLRQENNSNKADFETKLNELLNIIKSDREKNQMAHETILQEILAQLDDINKPKEVHSTPELNSHKLYKIVKGDTLGSIANAFGVPLQVLKKFNNLESDLIGIDQVLKIPVKEL